MGTPMREMIEEHAGGMRDGYELRAVLPGGASTPFVPAADIDVPMDFDHMKKAGYGLGTGTRAARRRLGLPGRPDASTCCASSPRSRAAGARPAGRACPGPSTC